MSLSLGWYPTPSSPLGLTAKVAPSWGGQSGGGRVAVGQPDGYGLGSHQMYGSGRQVVAEVGYGLPVGARLLGTPRVGLPTSEYGRNYRVGYGLGVLNQGKVSFELTAEAKRRATRAQSEASNGFMGWATLGWRMSGETSGNQPSDDHAAPLPGRGPAGRPARDSRGRRAALGGRPVGRRTGPGRSGGGLARDVGRAVLLLDLWRCCHRTARDEDRFVVVAATVPGDEVIDVTIVVGSDGTCACRPDPEVTGRGGFLVRFKLEYARVATPDLTRLVQRRDDQGRIPAYPRC